MIRFFARHPTAGNLLMTIFLVAGILVLPNLQRETFPDFAASKVEVRVPYPGASAEDVEEAVCGRIEDALDSVEGIDEIESEARENVGVVTVTMANGGDFVTFVSDVTSSVDGIDDFPDEAEKAVVSRLAVTDGVVSLAVSGPATETELKAYCEELRDGLRALPLSPTVNLLGFGEHQFRIEWRGPVLEQFGISASDVASVISRRSLDLPAGSIETSEREVLVRLQEERRSPEDFRDLVVHSAPNAGEVLLGEVATITERFDPPENAIFFNGKRAGILEIRKAKSQDSLRVLAEVEGYVERVLEHAPEGISIEFTENHTSIIRDRLDMLFTNGRQGFLLVFLAMWLFFAWRFSFWVAMGLPVSFLGALALMPVIGISINMLSMVALLLAIGILMDDAIVISENIATHLRQGKSSMQAAVDGTREVAAGVLASFLTTLCVLGPLAFLEGDIGKVLYAVPVVLAVVLVVSLVEAFLILPGHLAHALHKFDPDRPGFVQGYVTNAMDWLRDRVLGPTVDACVRWRYASIGIVIAAFIVSVGMLAGGRLKVQAFPSADGDVVLCRLLLPQGTPLSRTEAVVERLTTALATVDEEFTPRQPGGQRLILSSSVRYNTNSEAKESGPHVATIAVDLLSADVRDAPIAEVIGRWRELAGDLPDTLSVRYMEPGFGPAGRPIEVRIQGPDLADLATVANGAIEWLDARAGVFDLAQDMRPGKPEALLRLRPGATETGIDAESLARQVRAALYGATAAEMQIGSESVEVDVGLAVRDRDTLSDLEAFSVTLPSGSRIPLDEVANIEYERGFARIARLDGRRTVTVTGDVDSRVANTAEVMQAFDAEFVSTVDAAYPDVRILIEGEIKEGVKTQASMMQGMAIGLIGVFVLLSFQFRSYLEPLVVMAAIPFALIGVIWGHLLMGVPLTLPSILGFVSLSGIVVNDSILLVEFVKIRRRAGQAIAAAARLASRARFRAVMLTTVTTVLGLMPLMFETSGQAITLVPLAISIVFGSMASMLLVLLLIPSFYTVLGDFGLVEELASAPAAPAQPLGVPLEEQLEEPVEERNDEPDDGTSEEPPEALDETPEPTGGPDVGGDTPPGDAPKAP